MANRQIAWADFDSMLGDVEGDLAHIARFFGFPAAPDELTAIASGPLMSRYSKAPEHAYSPALRRELIGEALDRHGRQVDAALAMLKSAAEKSPLLARAMARAEEG
jgi:hypothetical protein